MANVRIKLRTKIDTPVSNPSQLAARELIAGDVEKSLFYKDRLTDDIYRFSPVMDSTVDSNSTWSSEKIDDYISSNYAEINHTHDYFDLTNIPLRSVLFTAAGIGLPDTNACSPAVVLGGANPYWSVQFSQNQSGFFNFLVPYDYTGSLTKLTLSYSDTTFTSQWEISGVIYNQSSDLTYPIATNTSTLSCAALTAGTIGIEEMVPSALFGDGAADLRMCTIKIKLITSHDVKFHGMRIDYI